MQPGMGPLDFFLLESAEYLEQLDALAQGPAGAPPNGDDFLRLTRAFRGSALMANQQSISRAAQGLEACARALRENRLLWDERVRGEIIRAIDDCKVLLRRLRTPEQGDSAKAEQIGATLDRLSGRASAVMRATAGPGLDAGGRAFVAREAAAIASTLQRAAQTLATDPANRDVFNAVLPSMSALRGVAAIQDLPPLADLLAAIEAAVKEVTAIRGPAPAAVPKVFESGGLALARAAREVVDQGRPDPDSQDAAQFAQLLLGTFVGGHVISIESLFFDDAGPHILHEGTPPQRAASGYERVELVSQGEFLTAAVAELRRAAASPVQCDLRLFTIAARLRPMVGAGGSPLESALGHAAEAARDAIGRGGAADALDEFVALIGHAAEALAGAQGGNDQALAERLESAAGGLDALTKAPVAVAPSRDRVTRPVTRGIPAVTVPPRAAPPPPAPPPAAPVAAPAPAAPAPVAMPAAAPAAPAPAVPAPQPLRPAAVAASVAAAPVAAPPALVAAGADALTASYLTLEQLIAERGLPLSSISELITAPTQLPALAGAAVAPDGDGAVPVASLVYRGERALRRALELRRDAEAFGPGDPRLPALLREVFDLVELGLESPR